MNEAVEPFLIGLKMRIEQKNWGAAAVTAGNLGELELSLGNIVDARKYVEQSVEFASQSENEFLQLTKITTLAEVLNQMGCRDRALENFKKAEEMQAKYEPKHFLLYSYQGFRYCDFLLHEMECACWKQLGFCIKFDTVVLSDGTTSSAESVSLFMVIHSVEERATQILAWEERMIGAPIFDLALHHLILGRSALYRAILSDSLSKRVAALQVARDEFTAAMDGLHRAGHQELVPFGLLSRACFRFLEGNPDGARADLDEAWEVAERGPMRLHMADIHLHRARLFHDKEELRKARAMIEECGYWRRKEELEDAEAAALRW